jgi:hypothetical protein
MRRRLETPIQLVAMPNKPPAPTKTTRDESKKLTEETRVRPHVVVKPVDPLPRAPKKEPPARPKK